MSVQHFNKHVLIYLNPLYLAELFVSVKLIASGIRQNSADEFCLFLIQHCQHPKKLNVYSLPNFQKYTFRSCAGWCHLWALEPFRH